MKHTFLAVAKMLVLKMAEIEKRKCYPLHATLWQGECKMAVPYFNFILLYTLFRCLQKMYNVRDVLGF